MRAVDSENALGGVEAPAVPIGLLELAPAGQAGTPTAHVRLGAFDGPLALLLALIETRELDVLSVPLGDLAEAFLEAVATLEEQRLASLSDFVSVASQLIVIKSRALVPEPPEATLAGTEEAGDPEEELRRRLLVYRAFRDAGVLLRERLTAAAGGLVHREPAVALESARAAAGGVTSAAQERLDVGLLVEALRGLARIAPLPEPPPETLGRAITIEECAAAIREALRGASVVVLQELLHGIRDRGVAAVTFLAMLELVKRREITVEQAEPWGDIVCRSV